MCNSAEAKSSFNRWAYGPRGRAQPVGLGVRRRTPETKKTAAILAAILGTASLLAAGAHPPRAHAADEQAAKPSLLNVLKQALDGREEERRRLEAERRAQQQEAQRRILQLQNAARLGGGIWHGGFIHPQYPGFNGTIETSASLKTDEDLDRLLKHADEFATDGRYELAVALWQQALNDSTDTVTTRDDWISKTAQHEYRKYLSVSEEIERSLAQLPPTGLRVYRATADGEAKAILATGEEQPEDGGVAAPRSQRKQALAEVVRRFFLSSFGDDAAFELACLEMEHYEFVGAYRLLNKVLQEYPDASIRREQLLLRLAVASGRIGDQQTAHEALAELDKSASGELKHASLVKRDIERMVGMEQVVGHASNVPRQADLPGEWRMRFGRPSRTGYMQAFPSETTPSPLTELWSKQLGMELTAPATRTTTTIRAGADPFGAPAANPFGAPAAAAPGRIVVHMNGRRILLPNNQAQIRIRGGGLAVAQVSPPTTIKLGSMVERWRKGGWNPARVLLFDQGRVYFKGNKRLVCCDATTGEMIWMGRENQYPLDPLSQLYAAMGAAGTNLASGQPAAAPEVVLFGDRVRQSMSIAGNLLLTVEGDYLDLGTPSRTNRVPAAIPQAPSTAYHRIGANWLSAYDAKNGKLQWYRSGDDSLANPNTGAGFLAAPVPYADLLLAPVTDNGQLWMYGMAAENGKTVWKTFLCDALSSGGPRWSPVGITVDGGDVYVASGAGAIFALDALSGALGWVATYERSKQPPRSSPVIPGTQIGKQPGLVGFQEDVVIPHGRQLIVMASDYDQLVAFDRRTGEFLWESPRNPLNNDSQSPYCLGAVGDGLYVADKNHVRQYDIPSGRLVWEEQTEDSLGRGALTETAVFVPLNDSILQLDLKTGAKKGQVQVVQSGDEPVGNLYSDGQRLLVVGMGRVYALGEAKEQPEEPNKQTGESTT